MQKQKTNNKILIDKIKFGKIYIGFFIFLIFFLFFSGKDYFLGKSETQKILIKYTNKISDKSINNKNFSSKEIYLIYGKYKNLYQGKYEAIFFLNSGEKKEKKITIDIASDKGKTIISKKKITIKKGENKIKLSFILKREKEIEPRLKISDNISNINVEKVEIKNIGNIFPLETILFKTLFFSFFSILLILSFLYCLENNPVWKKFLLFLLLFLSFYFILAKSWLSEDAFITFRHIENFISGYGPVFNPGERVEGFSHVLWFYILSLFRWIGFTIKASAIIPSLILSFTAIYIFLFKINPFKNEKTILNFSAPALLSASAFTDFGTSGLETPLSYLLLILYAKFLLEEDFYKNPILFGFLISLMVFTRPDFGVFLIIVLLFFLFELYNKKINFVFLLKFSFSSIIPLFLYEIFRMGYYAAIFPNPVYTKSATGSYFLAGINYFLDFSEGSLFLPVLIFALIIFFKDKKFIGRKIVLLSGFTHMFFVIRGGGDFMHGRFLLPSFILLSVGTIGILDNYFSRNRKREVLSFFLIIFIYIIGLSVKPAQKRGHYFNRGGISDERFAYYKDRNIPIKYLFKENLIFMWKTIGENYKYLTDKSKLNIRIAYKNVGFIGYYSGKRVYVLDKLGLTDPIVARLKINKRGRPGHEKYAPFPYLYYKSLTFSPTPFPLWNKIAKTDFGILWDISPKTLRKFSFFINKNFKKNIDESVIKYIRNIKPMKDNTDFLLFLNKFWLPYTKPKNKNLFLEKIDINRIKKYSNIYKWIERNKSKIIKINKRITGELTFKKFINNILFSIKNFNLKFK